MSRGEERGKVVRGRESKWLSLSDLASSEQRSSVGAQEPVRRSSVFHFRHSMYMLNSVFLQLSATSK